MVPEAGVEPAWTRGPGDFETGFVYSIFYDYSIGYKDRAYEMPLVLLGIGQLLLIIIGTI
jgi:hypothetical protein